MIRKSGRDIRNGCGARVALCAHSIKIMLYVEFLRPQIIKYLHILCEACFYMLRYSNIATGHVLKLNQANLMQSRFVIVRNKSRN
jgi:hypothetical protein